MVTLFLLKTVIPALFAIMFNPIAGEMLDNKI